jgi:hypothetical protein
MSSPSSLSQIVIGETELGRWQKTISWIWQACIAAGINLTPLMAANPLLTNIVVGETDLGKWQKLVAWLSTLAGGIKPAGAQAQASVVSLTAGVSSQAVVFSTAFTAAPAVQCCLIDPSGNTVLANPTSVSATGFTAQWGFPIPSGYSLSWIACPKTQ